MPGGDGTGPLGMGPMTGRATGYCAGYANPGPGFNPGRCAGGWGRGNRWGGQGFRAFNQRSYPYSNVNAEAYRVSSLEQEARYLESSLENIRRKIAEAKAGKEAE